MKYYTIKSIDGKPTCMVFTDWDNCKKRVNGHNAVYKSFKTPEEARNYLSSNKYTFKNLICSKDETYLSNEYSIQDLRNIYRVMTDYKSKCESNDKKEVINLLKNLCGEKPRVRDYYWVDGSFINGSVGWSFVHVREGKEIDSLYGRTFDHIETRNVAGELQAARAAIKNAAFLGLKEITIVHDYRGISDFIDGTFTPKDEVSREYKQFVDECKHQYGLCINFEKVKGHSGVTFNNRADELAGIGARLHDISCIMHFNDDCNFLDNTYSSHINYKSREFPCVLEAYNYQRKIIPSYELENNKVIIMHDLLLCKFMQNPNLKQKLISLGRAELFNNNYWGDDIWGLFNESGQNLLGKLLELVRGELNGNII